MANPNITTAAFGANSVALSTQPLNIVKDSGPQPIPIVPFDPNNPPTPTETNNKSSQSTPTQKSSDNSKSSPPFIWKYN